MKIGIGCTTYLRPEHLQLWIQQIKNHTNCNCDVYIADDFTGQGKLTCYDKPLNTSTFISSIDKEYKRQGIANRKNECLRHLMDCDYIFLFDDDCFPIKDGWVDYFIDAHKASGQHHFLYLKPTQTIKKTGEQEGINIFDNCGGCFMFLTKEVIEKVGGYGSYSNYYGMEHAGFTERIHMAGLTSMGKYLCPHDAGNFIFSLDYDYDEHYNKLVNHRPSMINEIDKIDLYIRNGMINFVEDIKQIYRPK